MEKKRIAVIGALGKMGQFVCRYILQHDKFELSACIDTKGDKEEIGKYIGAESSVKISTDLSKEIEANSFDIAIEFSTPQTVVNNALTCLNARKSIVIGATGISKDQATEIEKAALEMNTSAMIVPNFAIGAILMMDFAKKAAKYMPNAEIIELHHDQKLDKPSGTALKTRVGMLENIDKEGQSDELVPIHSVRLPGLVAHQEVIFGGLGQTLTIRHDSISRDSFMPGVGLALERIESFKGLKIGLEL